MGYLLIGAGIIVILATLVRFPEKVRQSFRDSDDSNVVAAVLGGGAGAIFQGIIALLIIVFGLGLIITGLLLR